MGNDRTMSEALFASSDGSDHFKADYCNNGFAYLFSLFLADIYSSATLVIGRWGCFYGSILIGRNP